MKKFIPALLLLCNASIAMAQAGPGDTPPATSTQQVVVQALNYPAPHPSVPAAQVPVQPVAQTTSGIGPSSNMPEPGDYGYSAWSDLRQLNF